MWNILLSLSVLLSLSQPGSTAHYLSRRSTCITTDYQVKPGNLLYSNTFNSSSALDGWVAEGNVTASVASNVLTLSSTGDWSNLTTTGPNGNFVYWLPETFPSNIYISFQFQPIYEPGLAMLFFGASKIGGGSIFDPSLAKRNGSYPQYYNGDIQTFHISYYRRGLLTERNFHTANLRKSPGFYLVAQGGDPLPDVEDVQGNFYNVTIVKNEGGVQFGINGLTIFSYGDSESDNTGPKIQDGKIGFRQMAPFIAQYRNLQVYDLGNSSYY